MPSDDRRGIQRIRFDAPLGAKLPTGKVTLVDVSATGALVEHDFPLARGKRVTLEFEFEGIAVSLQCTVIRCKLERTGIGANYRTGLAFDPSDPRLVEVRDLISVVVERDFDARKAHMKVH